MDVYAISEKTGVSVRTLKRIEKAGFLKSTEAKSPFVARIQENVRKGRPLTAWQAVHLAKNPGDLKYMAQAADDVEARMLELGDIAGEAAPRDVAAEMSMAARKDENSRRVISQWLRKFIDTNYAFANGQSQGHTYVASRLLYGQEGKFLEEDARLISSIMWQCRNAAAMRGCWSVDAKGHTQYHRERKYDL